MRSCCFCGEDAEIIKDGLCIVCLEDVGKCEDEVEFFVIPIEGAGE